MAARPTRYSAPMASPSACSPRASRTSASTPTVASRSASPPPAPPSSTEKSSTTPPSPVLSPPVRSPPSPASLPRISSFGSSSAPSASTTRPPALSTSTSGSSTSDSPSPCSRPRRTAPPSLLTTFPARALVSLLTSTRVNQLSSATSSIIPTLGRQPCETSKTIFNSSSVKRSRFLGFSLSICVLVELHSLKLKG